MTHPVEALVELERLDLAQTFLDALALEAELLEDAVQRRDLGDDLVLRVIHRLWRVGFLLGEGELKNAALLQE